MASIKINFSTVLEDPENPSLSGNKLVAETSEAEGIPNEVFIFQRNPKAGFRDPLIDEFWGVASLAQIESMGDDEESAESGDFYRTDRVELIFETSEQLLYAIEQLKTEVSILINAAKFMENSSPVDEEVVIS